MFNNITLTSSMRSNLYALKNLTTQMNKTQNRLASGLKINSAIDNASSYYQARALNNRASDLDALLDYTMTTAAASKYPPRINYWATALFYGNTWLSSAPELNCPYVTIYCYASMFYGCTRLMQAPALPALSLAQNCYYQMFGNCTSLAVPPSLPAMALANSCYSYMFTGCTDLYKLPKLNATLLVASCYTAMFYGCTNIKLSSSNTGSYTTAYRIPFSGTGNNISSAVSTMFTNTGGSFTGSPAINTTYYTSNQLVS